MRRHAVICRPGHAGRALCDAGSEQDRRDHRLVRGESQALGHVWHRPRCRSEEHTSELQSLMRISYAVFCLKKKKKIKKNTKNTVQTKHRINSSKPIHTINKQQISNKQTTTTHQN